MTEPVVEVDGTALPVNADGFLQEPQRWTPRFAEVIAASEGIDKLTDQHWKVIHYIRSFYLENNIAPMIRRLCKETGCNLKRIYVLFPNGPAKGACKLAGLPGPDGCV